MAFLGWYPGRRQYTIQCPRRRRIILTGQVRSDEKNSSMLHSFMPALHSQPVQQPVVDEGIRGPSSI